jgi:hypothetical protein
LLSLLGGVGGVGGGVAAAAAAAAADIAVAAVVAGDLEDALGAVARADVELRGDVAPTLKLLLRLVPAPMPCALARLVYSLKK